MTGVVAAGQAERAIAIALSHLGDPYVWATAGPDTFDCSGFTWYVAGQVLGPLDYELRSSHHQFNVWGQPVAGSPIAGDLVFFDTMGVLVFGNRASHVGLMIDAARFIHAANEDLDVRIDALASDWYAPRYLGARRIFDLAAAEAVSQPSSVLRFPAGPVRTPTPWNGQPFGVDWSLVARWSDRLEQAAAARDLDPRWLAVLAMIETQGLHERDGRVLVVGDNFPEDGPAVGLMQVKPQVWQYLCPGCDPYDVGGNIALAAAVLRELINRHGSFEAAIAEGYHPAPSPNGTTPARYVAAARGLLEERVNAA